MDIKALIEKMLLAGFKETTYQGQSDHFITKKTTVGEMPGLAEQMADDLDVHEGSEVFVELILSTNKIQVFIPDAQYVENDIEPFSENGKEVLAMAGVAF